MRAMARRAATLILALALLAPSFPLPLAAEDTASTTPPAAPETDTASSTPPADEPVPEVPEQAAASEAVPETPVTEEFEVPPSALRAVVSEPPPGLADGEQFLVLQDDASEGITFEGAAGGADHRIEPYPVHTALATGHVSKVRMYLARNNDEGLPGRYLTLWLRSAENNAPLCQLFGIGDSYTGPDADFGAIPIGDASSVVLHEFSVTADDCFLVKGQSYAFELNYRVPGDPRWTNGIIYTKGADTDNEFFLQIVGDTVAPPPPPETRPGERFLFNTLVASETITFDEAAGGATQFLQPYPVYTALGSGPVSRVRLEVARNRANENHPFFNNHMLLYLLDASTNARLCTLLEAGRLGGGQPAANYSLIPVGGAEDVSLVEFTSPLSDCIIQEGQPYVFQMTYTVGGDPRDVNGTLYFKGSDSVSHFFVQVLADDGAPGNSSVLFLPGIMGSRLSENGEERWEPSSESDLEALYFSPDGQSQSANIEATEVIGTFDSPAPLPDTMIYQSFFSDLAQMETDGEIASYAAAPYDWRRSIPDVVSEGSIETTLRALAEHSYTGKVTIVAHSNGGLVAKALLNELGPEASTLVDKVILVGVPQLGTPQAVGALLHGYDSGLPFDWLPLILSPERARDLARNMPMTYQLLPHADYYENAGTSISTPLVSFEDSQATSLFYGAYGETVSTSQEMRDFLLGAEGRDVPDYDDLGNPARVRTGRIADAEALMQSIGSSWVPPAGIEVHQIAGVGEETLAGIHYKTVKKCTIPLLVGGVLVCLKSETKLSYTPDEVLDGDGTVVTPSALLMSDGTGGVERWWINLKQNNDRNNRYGIFRLNHGTVFQVDELRRFVTDNLVTNNTQPFPVDVFDHAPTIVQDNQLRFYLHSPLDLSVTDKSGNVVDKNFAEIPNASFKRYGEVQVIHVPADAAPTVRLSGVADGSFTLDVEEYNGPEIVAHASFSGVPSLAETEATMEFPDGTVEGAGGLVVDYQGDGTADLVLDAIPGEVVSPGGDSLTDILTALEQAISDLSAPQKTKDKLLKRVAAIETKIEKKKAKNQVTLAKLAEKISKKAAKGKIAAQDADTLIALIETLELGTGEVTLNAEVLASLKASIQGLVAPEPLKQDLLRRVTKLENIQGLTNTLGNFSASIVRKGEKGKITEPEAQSLLDLLALVEAAI